MRVNGTDGLLGQQNAERESRAVQKLELLSHGEDSNPLPEIRCPSATALSGALHLVVCPETPLSNVLAQYGADLAEGAIQTTGQSGHSCRSSEGNQSQNQEIFHQALASFIFVKANQ
jgi:hypothetical protein